MPIYEYKCEKCGAEFEELVKNAADTPDCPKCKSNNVARRMSAPANARGGAADTPCGGDCGGERAHSCGCGCGCCH